MTDPRLLLERAHALLTQCRDEFDEQCRPTAYIDALVAEIGHFLNGQESLL